jgi:hypothetical protein
MVERSPAWRNNGRVNNWGLRIGIGFGGGLGFGFGGSLLELLFFLFTKPFFPVSLLIGQRLNPRL